MSEYQVPQFIEVEDKVFGPLTLKQFIFVAGGVGMCVALVLYWHVIGFIIAVPIAVVSGAFAFYKINNKSFTDITESAFNYFTGNRLYLWKKDIDGNTNVAPAQPAPHVEVRQKLGLNQGKLHDLARSLDIQDKLPEDTRAPSRIS